MFDDLIYKIKQIMASRLIPITIILVVLFSILINRLFEIQIIDGQENSDVASLYDTKTTYEDASRGVIRGSDGEELAYDDYVYTVELSDELSTHKERNEMLAYLIETLKEYGNELDVSIPITYDGEFEFTVSGAPLNTFKTNAFGQGKLNDEHANATAEEVFNYMREEHFYVDESYSVEEALDIITLRYAMYVAWPPQNPVVVCSDVNEETMVAISEREPKLQGVEVGKRFDRYYIENNEPFAHILGYTGLISESELESYKEEDPDKYDSLDSIGKTGIEKSQEEVLSGKKGSTEVEVDGFGNTQEVISSVDPVAGSDVYLSIDPQLQRDIYQLVEQKLSGVLLSKINNSKNVGTKGVSSSDIRIPIYDVYFAFINNEIIDISHFKEDDATDREKQAYQMFLNKLDEALNRLNGVLADNSTQTSKALSDEMNEYISFAYGIISGHDIINKEKVDQEDDVYKEYAKDEISLSQYLQYAISSNWINLDKLNIDNEYYDTKEVYRKLLEYLQDTLSEDKEFHKLIYYYLIDTYKLSGTEICLLLFDQGVLEYNEEDITRLKNGSISSYAFIADKIRKLEIKPGQLGLEPFSASVVVTDVNTGKVLALVSYPSYDSNNYADYLTNTVTSPLYPRAVNEALAPGSTFKMVSSIAGLEEGVITPYEKINDLYQFTKITPSPKCHFNNHGMVNVVEALEVSCNYFFYELGYRLDSKLDENDNPLGLKTLGHYSELLGLGQGGKTNLEEELSTRAFTAVSDNSAVHSAIGQGSAAFTPAELATYVTTIANGGKRFDLTLIDKVHDGEKFVENETTFTELDEISDSTWDYVRQGMYLVCNGAKGTTRQAFQELKAAGIHIAGKTGTAQTSKNNANNSLFVSYGPYEEPEISVTVVIPGGHSSGNASELGRDVYDLYFNTSGEGDLLSGEADELGVDTPAISD